MNLDEIVLIPITIPLKKVYVAPIAEYYGWMPVDIIPENDGEEITPLTEDELLQQQINFLKTEVLPKHIAALGVEPISCYIEKQNKTKELEDALKKGKEELRLNIKATALASIEVT